MKKKILYIGMIIVIIVLIVIFIKINVNNKKKENVNEIYWINENGDKINSSKGIEETKNVQDFTIEKSQIVRSNGISTLTAKVINNGEDKTNVKFEVVFYDSENKEITKTKVLVGNIKKGSYAYINAGISSDISSANNISYNIIE